MSGDVRVYPGAACYVEPGSVREFDAAPGVDFEFDLAPGVRLMTASEYASFLLHFNVCRKFTGYVLEEPLKW